MVHWCVSVRIGCGIAKPPQDVQVQFPPASFTHRPCLTASTSAEGIWDIFSAIANIPLCMSCLSQKKVSANSCIFLCAISASMYQSMMPGYEQERTSLLETQKSLAEAISASEQIYDDVEAFLPLVRQYTNLQELNARILNELIEKIVVHEKERGEDGTVTQQVDIYYKFIGYIDPAAMLNEAISPSDSSGNTKPIAIIV